MTGTERRYSGRELKEYILRNFHDWRVVTRKPTNHHCTLTNRKTGQIIQRGSNYEMMELLTKPNSNIALESQSWTGFNLEPYNDNTERKSNAQKAAEYALYWMEEAAELQSPDVLEPTIRVHRTLTGQMTLVINGVSYGKP